MKHDSVIKHASLIYMEKWDKLTMHKKCKSGIKFWGFNFAFFFKENILFRIRKYDHKIFILRKKYSPLCSLNLWLQYILSLIHHPDLRHLGYWNKIQNQRIMESFRLENTSKITESSTAKSNSKTCPWVPLLHIF